LPNLRETDPNTVKKFLKLVAEGEQGQAEAMLKQNKDLVLVPGDVTDLSGRSFKAITGFQYALWALDWHMWSMIKKYMSEEDIKAQVVGLDKGAWVNTHGVSANWQNLVTALDEQIRLIQAQKWGEAKTHWQRTVGGAQRRVPAHVVNEYCHPRRVVLALP
jgi:hypothetical protein